MKLERQMDLLQVNFHITLCKSMSYPEELKALI